MSTNLTYLAVLLVIGVLYGLTRPRKGNKRTSWVLKAFPQMGPNVQGKKTLPVVGAADTVVNPANPSEVVQILEEIYGDFTAESKRLEVEMTQAVAALRQETQENLAVISVELEELRRQLTTRSVQLERGTPLVYDAEGSKASMNVGMIDYGDVTQQGQEDSPRVTEMKLSVREAAPTKERVRIVENVHSTLFESVNTHEDPDLKYFNILDALVSGTDPLLICEQLGVTLEQVQTVQRLMSFPQNSPQ